MYTARESGFRRRAVDETLLCSILFVMRKKLFMAAALLPVLVLSCSKAGDLTIGRAMKAYQSQNYEEALSLFRQSLEEETNYSPDLIYNFIATIYLQQDDLESAVTYQEKICAIHPEYRNLVSLGMTYHLLGRDDEAESVYLEAVGQNPQKGEAYASLGAMYLGQGRVAEAVDSLEKAAVREPKIAVIHANLAVAYAKAGDEDKSAAEFRIAEEMRCENLDEFKFRAEN